MLAWPYFHLGLFPADVTPQRYNLLLTKFLVNLHKLSSKKGKHMWSISDIKQEGRNAFKANYWNCVIAALILTVISGAGGGAYANSVSSNASSASTSNEGAAFYFAIVAASALILLANLAVRVFLLNPLEVGCSHFFSKNTEDNTVSLGLIKEGFGDYGRIFGTLLLRDIFITLGCILLLIPGIILAYSYRLVPYIVVDEPNLSATEALKRSKELMYGNRWKSFLLDLSFIGWHILTILTLGILSFFWTSPYMRSADAVLYRTLLKEQN